MWTSKPDPVDQRLRSGRCRPAGSNRQGRTLLQGFLGCQRATSGIGGAFRRDVVCLQRATPPLPRGFNPSGRSGDGVGAEAERGPERGERKRSGESGALVPVPLPLAAKTELTEHRPLTVGPLALACCPPLAVLPCVLGSPCWSPTTSMGSRTREHGETGMREGGIGDQPRDPDFGEPP